MVDALRRHLSRQLTQNEMDQCGNGISGSCTDSASYSGGNNTETQDSNDGAKRLTKIVQCPSRYGGSFCKMYATATATTITYNAQGQRASYATTGSWGTITQHFWYRGGALGQVATVAGTTAYTDTYLYDPSGAPYELVRQ